jgi:hypothetical protein
VWRSFKDGEAFELEKPWVTRDVMLPFFFFFFALFFFFSVDFCGVYDFWPA